MNKKRLVAKVLQASGVLNLLEKIPRAPALYIFNHHRIGDRESGLFDRGVYSASARDFDTQLAFFKQKYHMLSAAEILDLPAVLPRLQRDAVIMTFDDGYRDNYEIAYPILKRHGIPGVFFVPTYVLDEPGLTWWDAVSYLVQNTPRNAITLEHNGHRYDFSLTADRAEVIRQILRIIKDTDKVDYDQFIADLAARCEMGWDGTADLARDMFMTPPMIREMSDNGMLFGAHGHTHTILTHLTESEQRDELQLAKGKLEAASGKPITLMSYPVGGKPTFSENTKRIAREIGYRMAFSFYNEGKLPGDHQDWFDLRRETIDYDDTLAMLRCRIQMLRLLDRHF